jgi:hypothetical protein
VHLLRDTIIATGPRLLVALGNVAARATFAAFALTEGAALALPTLARLERRGLQRGAPLALPPGDDAFGADFRGHWEEAWHEPPALSLLLITHPSGQNMSPFARVETAFHQRMRDARAALRSTVTEVLGRSVPDERAPLPEDGIYALPEWRERIGPHHARLDALWREKGL